MSESIDSSTWKTGIYFKIQRISIYIVIIKISSEKFLDYHWSGARLRFHTSSRIFWKIMFIVTNYYLTFIVARYKKANQHTFVFDAYNQHLAILNFILYISHKCLLHENNKYCKTSVTSNIFFCFSNIFMDMLPTSKF